MTMSESPENEDWFDQIRTTSNCFFVGALFLLFTVKEYYMVSPVTPLTFAKGLYILRSYKVE